jgi:uncharacterized membrane protein
MDLLFTGLKYLHILAGSLALLCGPIAMMNQNGGKLHRLSGKIYFYSMMIIVVSATVLAIRHEKWFLLMVAIFTLYIISTGYRSLKLKKIGRGQKAEQLDWLIWGLAVLAGLSLEFSGMYWCFGEGNSFGIVPMVFGFIVKDYQRFTRVSNDKLLWLKVHIGNMMGGYIATMTAFLVQNVHTDPAWIAWLAPTIVFVPVLSYTIRKFSLKQQKGGSILLEVNGKKEEVNL